MGGVAKAVTRAVSSIFGGGGKSSAPQVIYQEQPSPATAEAEGEASRNAGQRKIKRRKQLAGTILTSPLGDTGESDGIGNTLLGRQGQ